MASTNILKFNEANNSDLTQNDNTYSANTTRKNGIQAGIADPTLHNKLFFQTSVMAYALAQFIVGQGYDCIDSADPTIILNIANSINALVAKNNVNVAVNSLIWQANTKVAVGQFIIDAGIPVGCLAVVVTAGTTGATKPSWTAQGTSVIDNTAVWQIQSVNTFAFTGASASAGGTQGQVPTPAAGQQNNILTADGIWSSKSKVLGPVGKTQPTLTALVDWTSMATLNGGTDVRYSYNKSQGTGITGYGGDVNALNEGDILLKQDFSTFDALLVHFADDLCLEEGWELIPMWLFLLKFNSAGIVYLFNEAHPMGDQWQPGKFESGWNANSSKVSAASHICTNVIGAVETGGSVSGISQPGLMTVNGSFWGIFGANNSIRPSTKTRLNMPAMDNAGNIVAKFDATSTPVSFQNSTLIEIYGVTY